MTKSNLQNRLISGCPENIIALFLQQDYNCQTNTEVHTLVKKNLQNSYKMSVNKLIIYSNFFGMEKLDKAPREIFSPEIQKVSGIFYRDKEI